MAMISIEFEELERSRHILKRAVRHIEEAEDALWRCQHGLTTELPNDLAAELSGCVSVAEEVRRTAQKLNLCIEYARKRYEDNESELNIAARERIGRRL